MRNSTKEISAAFDEVGENQTITEVSPVYECKFSRPVYYDVQSANATHTIGNERFLHGVDIDALQTATTTTTNISVTLTSKRNKTVVFTCAMIPSVASAYNRSFRFPPILLEENDTIAITRSAAPSIGRVTLYLE